jgi:hypothetical protein
VADLILTGEIADKLRNLAERQGRTAESVVEEMLQQYPSAQETNGGEVSDEEAPPGSVAAFLRAALAADIHLEEDDLASRSREILDTEFAEYLKQRLDPDNG